MGYLVKKQKSNGIYYAYQESFRVKVDSGQTGKTRGSGRSKVCTRSVHLGSAESIVNRLQQSREPVSISARSFGLVSAAYQTAGTIGLQEVLAKHLKGRRAGVPLWIYFFVSIIEVGRPVTRPPPHRSRRAVFPHRALQDCSLPQEQWFHKKHSWIGWWTSVI